MKKGLLLINLGTPKSPSKTDIRAYLREFLSDPRVVDINPIGRWFLLNFFILPFRPSKIIKNYEGIYTPNGMPLLIYGQSLAEKMRARLDFPVEFAFRYGDPSIQNKLDHLKSQGCDEIIIFPLYPQYASSSFGSTVEKVYQTLSTEWNTSLVKVVPPFYKHPEFISCFVDLSKSFLEAQNFDHILMTFHGLPERQIEKSNCGSEICLKEKNCCDKITQGNRFCYRAQCFESARLIAAGLSLKPTDYTVCFQSRLGRTPWIKPYTDEVIAELAEKGCKKLLIISPSFTADCLETIDEISVQEKQGFLDKGGEELVLVPSLNDNPMWADAITKMLDF